MSNKYGEHTIHEALYVRKVAEVDGCQSDLQLEVF